MNPEEKQLLENLFDSLDRLFDREIKTIDVFHLLYATDKAIEDISSSIILSAYANELHKIVCKSQHYEMQREDALVATNKLREELNDLL